ncbi:universal stress protein [Prescottella defluvii]|nr:universal stress protein [Prescottella defluvii]
MDTTGVVVGVDESDAAFDALDWAARVAGMRHAPLHVAHALPTPGVYLSGAAVLAQAQFDEQLRESAEQVTARAREQLGTDHTGVEFTTAIYPGPPASALLDVGADAALLVLGATGAGRSVRRWWGRRASGSPITRGARWRSVGAAGCRNAMCGRWWWAWTAASRVCGRWGWRSSTRRCSGSPRGRPHVGPGSAGRTGTGVPAGGLGEGGDGGAGRPRRGGRRVGRRVPGRRGRRAPTSGAAPVGC